MKRIILLVGICLGLCSLWAEAGEKKRDISLTVYNQNFGVVRDVRYLDLKKGLNTVRFTDIPPLIERESVRLRSLTHPGSCWVQEQNFEYDLISTSQLLERYLNKEIQIIDKENRLYLGELLSHRANEIILRREDGTVIVLDRRNIGSIEFPALPQGLVTKPTLVWEIVSEEEGRHKIEVSYLTKGLNWTADYRGIISSKENSLSLDAYVTLNNTSGLAYRNAALKLVAGEVRRERERPRIRYEAMMEMVDPRAAPEFERREMFEYHIYTLPRRVSIENNQQKQILFLTSEDIPIKKIYTFEPFKRHRRHDRRVEPFKAPVKVTLQFKNDEESNLGKPLPAGRVKLYKETESGLEFIGEDSISHTPKSEEVRLYIGNAFDIIGEKKHTEHKKIAHNIFENSYDISLRNHKKEKVTVQVIERLNGEWWEAWEIIHSSHPYKKKDAHTIEFFIDIPPESSRSFTYTVRSER